MAVNTWGANASVLFAASKNMMAILNTHASRVRRISRMYSINTQTGAVTAGTFNAKIQITTISALTSPTAVTPFPYDSTNAALSGLTAGHAGTPTAVNIMRQYMWAQDECAAEATQETWQTVFPIIEVWNAGYTETNIQKLACRINEGVMFFTNTSPNTTASNHFEIEFTDEAS